MRLGGRMTMRWSVILRASLQAHANA